jgi:hypothetical protein
MWRRSLASWYLPGEALGYGGVVNRVVLPTNLPINLGSGLGCPEPRISGSRNF